MKKQNIKNKSSMSDVELKLTSDQQDAYDATESNQVVFVSGPAGTGKSFLIHRLKRDLTLKAIPYIILSSTGISAHHIEGMTVHGFLCRLKLKVMPITPETVIIVDEISMLGKKVMDAFEFQLRKHFSQGVYFDPTDHSRPFGGCRVVFFGDFAQLPPINDEYCFTSDAWEHIQAHCELTTIKRQNQDDFKTFLSHVRIGRLTRDDKLTIEQMTRNKLLTPTHLFLSNKEAEEFNSTHLEKLIQTGVTPSVMNANTEGDFSQDERDSFFNDRHQCYQRLIICPGARCMLTANLDVQNGWCNGTLATVVSVKENDIIIQNTKGQCVSIQRRAYKRYKKRSECDVICTENDSKALLMGEKKKKKKRTCGRTDCEHTPVYTYLDDDFDKDAKKSESSLTVSQFPLLLAWGMTIHKSQGMTLESCTITLPFIYSPSLIYVALSRCIALDKIVLKTQGPIRYEQICPSPDVMRSIFKWENKTCRICQDVYLGPYASFCQDCCSAPGKFSFYRFIDFIPAANPTPVMLDYMSYAVQNPTKSQTVRWKKFIAFAKSPMCI